MYKKLVAPPSARPSQKPVAFDPRSPSLDIATLCWSDDPRWLDPAGSSGHSRRFAEVVGCDSSTGLRGPSSATPGVVSTSSVVLGRVRSSRRRPVATQLTVGGQASRRAHRTRVPRDTPFDSRHATRTPLLRPVKNRRSGTDLPVETRDPRSARPPSILVDRELRGMDT